MTMLKPTVIFTVITILLSAQYVQSRALKSLNIQGILKSLQQQLRLEQLAEKKRQQFPAGNLDLDQDYNSYLVRSSNKKQRHQDRDDRDDRDDDDDDNDRRDKSPQLLHQLGRVYDKQSRDLEKLLNKPRSANALVALHADRSDDDRDNRHHKSRLDKKSRPGSALVSLLDDEQDDDRDNRHHKSRSVKKSRPGSALASLLGDRHDDDSQADDREDHLQDLNSYKSVYLVLDPEAVEKSHNKDKLGNLLSKLLNGFRQSNKRDRKEWYKKRHYQGFSDDNLSGRRKGNSKEKYSADASPERDYKPPKRSRPERSGGGGGGGAGGRTAIPYRGHRGDIYERDQ